jgi:hypothetical protein
MYSRISGNVLAQGDLLKQVAAFLTEQYGIPKELLELKPAKGGK